MFFPPLSYKNEVLLVRRKAWPLGRRIKGPFQVDKEILPGLNGVRGEKFNAFNKSQQAVVTTERSVGYMKYVFGEHRLEPLSILEQKNVYI